MPTPNASRWAQFDDSILNRKRPVIVCTGAGDEHAIRRPCFAGSLVAHITTALTFLTLLLGFVGLNLVFLLGWMQVLGHGNRPDRCALLALCMMAKAIFAQVFG